VKSIFAGIFLLMTSFSAVAGCWLDEKEYPTGAVVDGYECGSDGYWKKT